MPGNRPNPRPAAGGLLAMIALAVLLIAAAVPAVSAEEYPLIDNYYESSSYTFEKMGTNKMKLDFSELSIRAIDFQRSNGLKNIYVKTGAPVTAADGVVNWTDWKKHQNIAYDVAFYDYTTNTSIGGGDISYDILYDWLGNPDEIQFWIEIDEWHTFDLTGQRRVKMVFPADSPIRILQGWFIYGEVISTEKPISFDIGNTPFHGRTIYNTQYEWSNYLTINDHEIVLTRMNNASSIIINSQAGNFSDFSVNDIKFPSYPPLTWNVTNARGEIFTGEYGEELADSGRLSLYIKNSQTGALLANAHLAILASAGGTETEVVNATLPGGTGTYILQPTGGGSPNPDYYRAVATVPGFSQIIENHSFTLNGPHDVIIEMRPDTGGPLDPERAYLEFYVRDFAANPIPAASIQCGGRILQTNSAGYAVFEVPKNSTHPWIAKKSGYTTIEGTATVADGPRYVVNVVLGPGTVPTYTPGPGETPGGPGATPTPDTRTNEQKGQEVIDLIADFALPIAILAILATLSGLLSMMMPRRR